MSPRQVVILGCSGNCIDILDTLLQCNLALGQERYRPLGFLDDSPAHQGSSVHGYPVLGGLSSLAQFGEAQFVTAIGSSQSFPAKPVLLQSLGLPRERYVTVIHPSAQVSSWAELGLGCVVLQQVTITAGARLQDHVVVLPGCVISHDACIGDYSILAGGVIVSGYVKVEANCYLGAGSRIRERLTVGAGALVGMGSVVVRSVPPQSVVVGNPARPLGKKEPVRTDL